MSEKDVKLSPEEYQNKMLAIVSAQGGCDVIDLIKKLVSEKNKAAAEVIEEVSVEVLESVSDEDEVPAKSRFAVSPHDVEMRKSYEDAYQKVAEGLTYDMDGTKKKRFLPLMAYKAFKEQNVRWAKYENGKIIDKEVVRPRKRIGKYDSYMCLVSPEDYDKANNLDSGYVRSKIYQGTNVLFLADEGMGQFMKTICVMQGLASLMERINEKKNAKDGHQINATYRVGLCGCLTVDYLTDNGFSYGVNDFLNKYNLDNPELVADFLLSCSQKQMAELDPFFSDEPSESIRDRMNRNGLYVWALMINSSESEDRESFNFRSLPDDIYGAYRRFEREMRLQRRNFNA